MNHLIYGAALFITALTLAGSACATEAPLSHILSVNAHESGLTTEAQPRGFTLVTLGTWPQPEVANPNASPVRAVSQLSKGRTSGLPGTSFPRAIYLPQVQAAERQFALPEGLLDAVIWTESHYNSLAVSKAGAVGLGQLMPGTAQAMGVSNRYNPSANLYGAARYLRRLLDQFGAIHLAVAAYNAGPRTVLASGGIPYNAETPNYVRKVLAVWRR